MTIPADGTKVPGYRYIPLAATIDADGQYNDLSDWIHYRGRGYLGWVDTEGQYVLLWGDNAVNRRGWGTDLVSDFTDSPAGSFPLRDSPGSALPVPNRNHVFFLTYESVGGTYLEVFQWDPILYTFNDVDNEQVQSWSASQPYVSNMLHWYDSVNDDEIIVFMKIESSSEVFVVVPVIYNPGGAAEIGSERQEVETLSSDPYLQSALLMIEHENGSNPFEFTTDPRLVGTKFWALYDDNASGRIRGVGMQGDGVDCVDLDVAQFTAIIYETEIQFLRVYQGGYAPALDKWFLFLSGDAPTTSNERMMIFEADTPNGTWTKVWDSNDETWDEDNDHTWGSAMIVGTKMYLQYERQDGSGVDQITMAEFDLQTYALTEVAQSTFTGINPDVLNTSGDHDIFWMHPWRGDGGAAPVVAPMSEYTYANSTIFSYAGLYDFEVESWEGGSPFVGWGIPI